MNTGPSGTLYRVRIGVALAAAGALLAACGSSSKGASTGGTVSTSPSSKSVSTNLGGGSFCDKAKQASANVSSAAASLATNSPEKIKEFETNALAELKALQDQAPTEIKGAIGTVLDDEQKLFNDLQSNNFDFTKVGSDIQSLFSSSQFVAAEGQLTSYLSAKCGINPSAVPS